MTILYRSMRVIAHSMLGLLAVVAITLVVPAGTATAAGVDDLGSAACVTQWPGRIG
ncbi:hypothetical protein LZG04_01340 [Saccharothrix sp. S26]|uniref:hypothetical protein n=1 Tax=Saccharothrix sp. S26 TaxID=2907215 RepID=UPI001F3F319F|nr:hypothetical protein [Saccharothrix sp. S26]MCE6993458.1 hypothetical protein [Saccharothrix sp. S26]